MSYAKISDRISLPEEMWKILVICMFLMDHMDVHIVETYTHKYRHGWAICLLVCLLVCGDHVSRNYDYDIIYKFIIIMMM